MSTRARRASTAGGLIKITLQVAPDELDRIDKHAAYRGCSRSLAVRELIEKGFRLLRVEQTAARKALREAS